MHPNHNNHETYHDPNILLKEGWGWITHTDLVDEKWVTSADFCLVMNGKLTTNIFQNI